MSRPYGPLRGPIAEPVEPARRVTIAISPMVPTHFRLEGGGRVPVEALPDSALRDIAKRWTALLLLMARNKRKAKERGR